MGTRSTISFIEKDKNGESTVACIYQQYDGYLEGVGKSLVEWLMPKIMVTNMIMLMECQIWLRNMFMILKKELEICICILLIGTQKNGVIIIIK